AGSPLGFGSGEITGGGSRPRAPACPADRRRRSLRSLEKGDCRPPFDPPAWNGSAECKKHGERFGSPWSSFSAVDSSERFLGQWFCVPAKPFQAGGLKGGRQSSLVSAYGVPGA